MSKKWLDYFMGFAKHAASISKDTTKVGAILVGPEGEIRLTAYNGPPKGVKDTAERLERPTKYMFASHAEANLVAFAARSGISTKDCTVYVTHMPCAACTRTIIQAGISKVVCGNGRVHVDSPYWAEQEASLAMFRESGVTLYECV